MQIYKVLLFCLILRVSEAYYFVGLPPLVELLFYLLIYGAGIIANKGIHFKLRKHQLIFLFVVLVSSLICYRGINGISVFVIMKVLIVAQLFQLDDWQKSKVFLHLNRWIWILTILSVTFYLLAKIGMPSIGTVSWKQYTSNNYLFYFEDIRMITRFNGFTLEPGYMGILMTVMLVVNRFKMNKYTLVYLLVLIMTMSLGGLFITIVAFGVYYALFNSHKKKLVIGIFAALILGFSSVYFVANAWNNGDNLLNEWIFSRLEYDEEKGFAGNNRAAKFDQQLAFLSFLNSDDIYMGMGNTAYTKLTTEEDDWAGYTTFIMKYGFIPMIFLFLAGFYYIKSLNNAKLVVPAAIVWLLDWWQHSELFPPTIVMMFLFFELYSKPKPTKRKLLVKNVNNDSDEFIRKAQDISRDC